MFVIRERPYVHTVCHKFFNEFTVMEVTSPLIDRGVAQAVFHTVTGKVYKNYI
jgi:hypothetical protein